MSSVPRKANHSTSGGTDPSMKGVTVKRQVSVSKFTPATINTSSQQVDGATSQSPRLDKAPLLRKSLTLSTRQNTLDSQELDQIALGMNSFKHKPKIFSVRNKPLNIAPSELGDLLKRKINLPKVGGSKKILLRSDTEVLPPLLPALTQTPSQVKLKEKSGKKVMFEFGNFSGSDRTIKDFVENMVLTKKPKCIYYVSGLMKYLETRDDTYENYYQHLKRSHFSLRELKSDRVVEELSGDGWFPFRRKKKLVLALDLDETLIHCCNFDPPEKQRYKHAVNYKSENGIFVTAKINVRPYLQEFLSTVSTHYDIVIYTASDRDYAMAIVNFIDPQRKYIDDVFHRENCLKTKKGFVVKDLKVILPKELDRIVLVDNSAQCFAPQLKNGIPIVCYRYNEEDRELLHLRDFLLELKDQASVQDYLEQTFRLSDYANFAQPEQLLKHLATIQK